MENKTSRFDKFIMPFITLIIPLWGSFYIANTTVRNELNSWRTQNEMLYKKEIFNKRIQLIERTMRVIAQKDKVEQLSLVIDNAFNEQHSKLKKGEIPKDVFTSQLQTLLKQNDFKVDFVTTMSLDNIYFGPKTRNATSALNYKRKKWWDIDQNKTNELIKALGDELYFGMDNNK